LPRVVAVRHVREHVLWLRFADGLEGEIDLADGLRGSLFAPLRDPRTFSEVHLEGGTIAWPNGADWAPETLHDRVRAANGLPPQSFDDGKDERDAHIASMPEISRFFGIVIHMLADEHNPPHFHAQYAEHAVSVTIRDGVVSGRFPGHALRMVLEWGELHETELLANWDRLRNGQPAVPVPPLE